MRKEVRIAPPFGVVSLKMINLGVLHLSEDLQGEASLEVRTGRFLEIEDKGLSLLWEKSQAVSILL